MKRNIIQSLESASDFAEVISILNKRFKFSSTGFTNNGHKNDEGDSKSKGSLKLLAVLKFINYSDKDNPAQFFKEHYESVVADPDGDSHPNIRHLMKGSLKDVHFYTSVIPAIPK